MITRVTDPLPPNSAQPYPAWIMNRHREQLARISLAALKAKAAILCAPNPAAYLDLGPQVVTDVMRAPQNDLLTGQSGLNVPPPSPTPAPISNAPTVVPLNLPNDMQVLPVASAPIGVIGAAQQQGVPWGNSPVTPPGPPAGSASIPAWAWVAGALLIGFALSGGSGRQRPF